MEHTIIIYNQLADSLSRDFGMETSHVTKDKNLPNDIQIKLTCAIKYLLDKDMNKLMNILYRIDVPESKVAKILSESPVETMAQELAGLIIERQIQKIIS